MQVRFYQLASSSTPKVLAKLLEKIYEQNERVVVLCPTEEVVKVFNDALWTYNPSAFLPHGTAQEGYATEQPIWLSSTIENPNNASVCISMIPIELENLSIFKTVVYFFEASQRELFVRIWQECQKREIPTPIFWEQASTGEWINKDFVQVG